MYDIIYSPQAQKLIRKIEKQDQKRILAAMERIRIRPEKFVKKLVGNPLYSLRIGTYRVILDMQHEKILIPVLKIGHRRNIYK